MADDDEQIDMFPDQDQRAPSLDTDLILPYYTAEALRAAGARGKVDKDNPRRGRPIRHFRKHRPQQE
jgi:hypothetical protein